MATTRQPLASLENVIGNSFRSERMKEKICPKKKHLVMEDIAVIAGKIDGICGQITDIVNNSILLILPEAASKLHALIGDIKWQFRDVSNELHAAKTTTVLEPSLFPISFEVSLSPAQQLKREKLGSRSRKLQKMRKAHDFSALNEEPVHEMHASFTTERDLVAILVPSVEANCQAAEVCDHIVTTNSAIIEVPEESDSSAGLLHWSASDQFFHPTQSKLDCTENRGQEESLPPFAEDEMAQSMPPTYSAETVPGSEIEDSIIRGGDDCMISDGVLHWDMILPAPTESPLPIPDGAPMGSEKGERLRRTKRVEEIDRTQRRRRRVSSCPQHLSLTESCTTAASPPSASSSPSPPFAASEKGKKLLEGTFRTLSSEPTEVDQTWKPLEVEDAGCVLHWDSSEAIDSPPLPLDAFLPVEAADPASVQNEEGDSAAPHRRTRRRASLSAQSFIKSLSGQLQRSPSGKAALKKAQAMTELPETDDGAVSMKKKASVKESETLQAAKETSIGDGVVSKLEESLGSFLRVQDPHWREKVSSNGPILCSSVDYLTRLRSSGLAPAGLDDASLLCFITAASLLGVEGNDLLTLLEGMATILCFEQTDPIRSFYSSINEKLQTPPRSGSVEWPSSLAPSGSGGGGRGRRCASTRWMAATWRRPTIDGSSRGSRSCSRLSASNAS